MSFRFTWAHPATQVFVTGSFDNWSKSVELDKVGGIFEKTVQLPPTSDKIVYKFVVDGKWIDDHTAKTETDHEGNVNNVLYPSDITPTTASAAISSVAPSATTTTMAGEQPLATPTPIGAFPETPAGELNKEMSVNPIAPSEGTGNPIKLAQGAPVPHPSTLSNNTVTSQVHDDPELVAADKSVDQTFSVNPIPATTGLSNPVSLAHGEAVPHPSTVPGTGNDTVKLDKASYERSDATVLPSALSAQSEKAAAGAPIFGLGPQVIPEAGIPVGDSSLGANQTDNLTPNISSVAPTSTTNQLAGAVPLEPRGVPEIVDESQQTANVSPEASANPEAVVEKSEVEQELKSKVPEEPATSESGLLGNSERGVTGVAAGGLAAAAATATAAISSVMGNTTTNNLAGQVPKEERGVPEMVSESQQEAKASPEAAANPEAVQEKSEVEQELLSDVPKAPATSESGLLGKSEGGVSGAIAGGVAAAGAAAAGTAYALREKTKEATGKDPVAALPTSVQQKIDQSQPVVTSATITDVAQDTGVPAQYALGNSAVRSTTSTVPSEVTASQQQAHASSEAAGNTEAVREKSAVEQELLCKVKEDDSRGQSKPADTLVRETTDNVPNEVKRSQKEAHASAEASASPGLVREKQIFEQQLLSKVKEDDSRGQPAPDATSSSTAPGTATTTSASGAPQLSPIAAAAPIDLGSGSGSAAAGLASSKENKVPASGEVSPMTNVDGPTVTTGVGSARAPNQSNPEKRGSFIDKLKGTPESSTDGEGNKKRRSFFGKLKDKLHTKP